MLNWINTLPQALAVFVLATLPIFELRGAIPFGFYLGLAPLQTFCLALAGNLLPVIPLLFLLEPVSQRLRKFPLWDKFFDGLFQRTRKNAKIVERYAALGLILFVAVPLPFTGAWTGAVAASLFKIKFRYAFYAISLGVIIAGLIVMFLCLGGKLVWHVVR